MSRPSHSAATRQNRRVSTKHRRLTHNYLKTALFDSFLLFACNKLCNQFTVSSKRKSQNTTFPNLLVGEKAPTPASIEVLRKANLWKNRRAMTTTSRRSDCPLYTHPYLFWWGFLKQQDYLLGESTSLKR